MGTRYWIYFRNPILPQTEVTSNATQRTRSGENGSDGADVRGIWVLDTWGSAWRVTGTETTVVSVSKVFMRLNPDGSGERPECSKEWVSSFSEKTPKEKRSGKRFGSASRSPSDELMGAIETLSETLSSDGNAPGWLMTILDAKLPPLPLEALGALF